MATLEEIPMLLQLALSSGGSGHGMTYWKGAAACGKQALLYDERNRERREQTALVPTDLPNNKRNAFAVGGAYHKMHELWRKGELEALDLSKLDVFALDASVAFGVHLFRGWQSLWPRDFWGQQREVEVVLPQRTEAATFIESMFGEMVNAKPDLVVYIGEADLSRVQERCPAITYPGNYLVDFKTAGGAYDREYYTEGLQAIWYPYAYNVEHPDAPVEGTIFDIVYKPRANAKDQTVKDFHAEYAPLHSLAERIIAGLVAQGRANKDRAREYGVGNPAECRKFGVPAMQICPFLGHGCEGI